MFVYIFIWKYIKSEWMSFGEKGLLLVADMGHVEMSKVAGNTIDLSSWLCHSWVMKPLSHADLCQYIFLYWLTSSGLPQPGNVQLTFKWNVVQNQ